MASDSLNLWTVTLSIGSTLALLLVFASLFVPAGSASAVALKLSLLFLAVPVLGSLLIIYVGWRPFQESDDEEESVFD